MKKHDNKTKITTEKQKLITLVVGILVLIAIGAGGCALNSWGNHIEEQMTSNTSQL